MAACGRRSLRGTHGPLFPERGRAEIRVVPWCAALPALIPGCEWDPGGAEAGRAGNSFSLVSGSQAAGGDGGTTRSRGSLAPHGWSLAHPRGLLAFPELLLVFLVALLSVRPCSHQRPAAAS